MRHIRNTRTVSANVSIPIKHYRCQAIRYSISKSENYSELRKVASVNSLAQGPKEFFSNDKFEILRNILEIIYELLRSSFGKYQNFNTIPYDKMNYTLLCHIEISVFVELRS